MTSTIVKTVTAVKAEDQEGVAETLVAADTIETLVAPSLAPNLETITREKAGGTLTESPDQASRSSGALTIPMELAGPLSGVPTAAPTWSTLMQACGFRATAVKIVTIDGVTTAGDSPANGFRHGEVVTFAPSTATGRVVGAHDFTPITGGFRMTLLMVEQLTGAAILSSDTAATGSIGVATVISLLDTDNGLRDGIAWEPWDLSLGVCELTAAPTTPFSADEIVVGGTSGARARWYATLTTPARLVFERWLGSPAFVASETLTGSLGGAAATHGTNGAETWYSLPSLTLASQLPGIERALYGARGTFALTLANGQLAGLQFVMTGKHPKPIEVSPFGTAPVQVGARPPKVTGSQVRLNGVWTPCFQVFTLQSESTVALRECLPDATGFESTLLVDRKIRGQIDPEAVSEGLFPYLGRAWDKTPFLFEMIVGDALAEDGNAFLVRAPEMQFTGYSPGDRERIPIHTLPLKAGGTYARSEFVLAQM